MIQIILLQLWLSFTFISPQNVNFSKYQDTEYEVSCTGTAKDGTQFVKVFSYHKKPKKAIEACKKNAVHALLFKGIQQGNGCAKNPLINASVDLNKYDAYFTAFFEEAYKQYIITSTDQNPEMWRMENKKYKLGISVQVNYAALRQRLEADNIIKKLDHGF